MVNIWRYSFAINYPVLCIFIPQSFLAFGPYINVSNWTFIIIAILITPIAFYVDHHFYNRDANTHVKDLLSVFPRENFTESKSFIFNKALIN